MLIPVHSTLVPLFSADYKLTMAALATAVLPTVAAFVLFQEQIMKGMTAGAVKG